MEIFKDWVKDIFMIILSITFMEILIPESNMEKYLRFIFSMIVLATILSPIRDFWNK